VILNNHNKHNVSCPEHLSDYSKACLNALTEAGLGHKVSLGGAVGLMYFYEYRMTNDLDAWWSDDVTEENKISVVQTIERRLQTYGEVQTRKWGDVTSIELVVKGLKVFSFQIARRTARLEKPLSVPWTGVSIDSFKDLVAAKMTALVERGAPRDFRDIFELCNVKMIEPGNCWDLWQLRQELSGSDTDYFRARMAIETHLSRFAQHRPLEKINDARERDRIEKVRNWFWGDFLNAIKER